MLYLPGWGFNVDVLAYHFPVENGYQAIAWSLGIVRLVELLKRRNLFLEKALLLACPRKLDRKEVENFVLNYRQNPQKARYSFYRKCLWRCGVDWKDAEKFFELTGELSEDMYLLEKLLQINNIDLNVRLLAERVKEIDIVVTEYDLVVPYRIQLQLIKELKFYHKHINVFKVATGHYLFNAIHHNFCLCHPN